MTKDSYMKAVMQGLNNVDEVEVVLNSTQTSSNEEPETVINSFGNEIKQTRKIHVRILLSIDRRQTTESAMETVCLPLNVNLPAGFIYNHKLDDTSHTNLPYNRLI